MVELKLPSGEVVRGFKDKEGNIATEDGFVYSSDGRVLCKPRSALGDPNQSTHRQVRSGAEGFTPGVTLLDADKVRPEAISWLWHGWLARGKVHILAGAPSAGKTSAALALAAIITRGGRWPDGSAAKPGAVAIWSGEDGIKDVLVPRLLAAGADRSRVKLISGYTDYGGSRAFDPATDMEALSEAFALSDDSPVLLIVDPIVSAVGGDSNQSAQVRRSLQPLVDLADTRDCAVLGISHFSKGTAGRDPVERVTGSLAFGALARIVLAAAKLPDDQGGGRMLVKAKSNLGPDIGGFRYDLEAMNLESHPEVESTRVVWGEHLEGNARELLSRAETATDPEEHSAKEDAKDFLRKMLAAGPIPSKILYQEAAEAGHAKRTLQRAQKELGIKPERIGKIHWQWKLPEIERQQDLDVSLGNVGELGNLPCNPDAIGKGCQDRQHDGEADNTASFEGEK